MMDSVLDVAPSQISHQLYPWLTGVGCLACATPRCSRRSSPGLMSIASSRLLSLSTTVSPHPIASPELSRSDLSPLRSYGVSFRPIYRRSLSKPRPWTRYHNFTTRHVARMFMLMVSTRSSVRNHCLLVLYHASKRPNSRHPCTPRSLCRLR
ncbi:hypothetical protein L226DRAFT_617478, partial [Lentinus tigrinus ALCF2SS1-7]|uniref:uncharacterized protein n=1 Tax=Lentinus tigrinus ALCF2SS1-7 TaxID=1328758 RepID=UPI001166048C